MFIFLFWASVLFILYTYFGYPVLIRQKANKKQKHTSVPAYTEVPDEEWPTVSIVVPVHNEAHHVERKINNLREIDYPKDKLTITFVSDGSEDGTNELIKQFPDVSFIEYHPRQGKPTALNTAAEQQTSEVIVFTDARQTLGLDAVKKLVNRLRDPAIGAVSGELCFGSPDDVTAQNVGLYWKYEKAIRNWEGQVHSVAGVTGALYAIRREDFVPLYPDALLDDFEVPIQILRKGKRIVFEAGAFVYDQAQSDVATEKKRKIRTLTGNYQSFNHNKWLFTSENPILWQFLSHKVFRLLVPYAMIIAFITNLILAAGYSVEGAGLVFYSLTYLAQVAFYGLGFAASKYPRLQQSKIPNLAAVFIKLNWAAVQGYIEYRQKRISVRWEKTS